jgi:CRP-like cAMP-binding protein
MSINLFNKCISVLLKNRKNREIDIEPIYQYLKTFKSFIFLLQNQSTLTIEKLLTEISNVLELRKVTKNELIFQQGELAENFYIILKGNLKVLKLRPYEYYMTNEEYISFLLDLRMNNQSEIIRQSKHYNNLIYPIPENFDYFVKNLSNKIAGGIYIDMHHLIEKAEEVNKFIQQEEEMKLKNNMKLSPKEYIKKFKVSDDIINNTEIISNFINEKNIIIDPNEMNKIKLLMKDRRKVIIPNYEEFIQLSTGNTFEDQAFEKHGNYYQSSVISLDDNGYLGYINKKKYNLLIHESVEKRNKKIFGLLVYFSFMKLSNQFLFEKKYLTYINDKVFDVNHEIFKEGEESEYTYFLTEGEFELSMNKSIIEINEMIIEYKKILKILNGKNKFNKQILDFEEEKRQNNDIILNKKFRNDDINELLMKKRYIKLNIIEKKDILGLSDIYAYNCDEIESKKELLIYESVKKKCLFSCKCLNSNCHAFYLPNSIFIFFLYLF